MAKITGGRGNDIIIGTNSSDTINADGGNDIIFGNGGDDTIVAGTGDDIVFGGVGKDKLSGNAGNDYLDGEGGSDVLDAGAGNDTLVWDAADASRLGGLGFDILKVLGSGVTANLSSLTKTQLSSIEQVDLNGSGANTLKVTYSSIKNSSADTNQLTGLKNSLVVRLGQDDSVDKGG